MSSIERRQFDTLIIGAGGGGLRASLQLAEADLSVAVVSKVFPTRSHTVAAQGGMNAALANVSPDNWHWHMFDTVKGSDYLGDQDAIEYMCRAAPKAVYELEHFGVPFSRLDNGKIYQRAFGGQSQNFGGAQASRTCAAADRTGHAILHSLYQQNIRAKTHFFDEYFAVDLLKDDDGHVLGAVVFNIQDGQIVVIEAKTTLLATGGAGQLFKTTTNALINTGDGMGMAMRAGIPLQDMEFFQFHPTGIAGRGMLITEGARGEGGYLVNADGERLMERYAPKAKDLASRDACITFLGIDPAEAPIPVFPTAHYTMGGIPTNRYGQVVIPVKDTPEEPVQGLYAAGECACVSVHGGNRLGGNSLLDILVFGRAAANHIIGYLKENKYHKVVDEEIINRVIEKAKRFDRPAEGTAAKETVAVLRDELKQVMEDHCGVFRNQDVLKQGVEKVEQLIERMKNIKIDDQSFTFNTAKVEAFELDNLMACALATIHSAYAREESRGAHSRVDFPQRDDMSWMRHSLYSYENGLDYKPVRTKPMSVESFPPKPRVY
jgi:succinate dehydrogenase / fumarate reductase flavoprotein subunit